MEFVNWRFKAKNQTRMHANLEQETSETAYESVWNKWILSL